MLSFVFLWIICFVLGSSNGNRSRSSIFRSTVFGTSKLEKSVMKGDSAFAFQQLANFLKRYSSKTPFREYSAEDINSAIQTMAFSQSYTTKALDGLTHRMKNTFKER
jgi:hypothetical protein